MSDKSNDNKKSCCLNWKEILFIIIFIVIIVSHFIMSWIVFFKIIKNNNLPFFIVIECGLTAMLLIIAFLFSKCLETLKSEKNFDENKAFLEKYLKNEEEK